MKKQLPRQFFARPAAHVARDLLGMHLMLGEGGQVPQAYRITETEAYVGPHDAASHARRGRTARTAPMFAPPGTFYVYLIYGMYWMLNVATDATDYPAAVLIRGVSHPEHTLDGPGKLTKHLGINKRFNHAPATRSTGLWFAGSGEQILDHEIAQTSRIGVAYAGEWADAPLRFVLQKDSVGNTGRQRKSGT